MKFLVLFAAVLLFATFQAEAQIYGPYDGYGDYGDYGYYDPYGPYGPPPDYGEPVPQHVPEGAVATILALTQPIAMLHACSPSRPNEALRRSGSSSEF